MAQNPTTAPATSFYREKMDAFLKGSTLPPTEWELKNEHENLQKEAFNRFRSYSVDSNVEQGEKVLEADLTRAFSEVKRNHKELRSKTLIDSVLGRNNYVVKDHQ